VWFEALVATIDVVASSTLAGLSDAALIPAAPVSTGAAADGGNAGGKAGGPDDTATNAVLVVLLVLQMLDLLAILALSYCKQCRSFAATALRVDGGLPLLFSRCIR
jgi:hypothetical protein